MEIVILKKKTTGKNRTKTRKYESIFEQQIKNQIIKLKNIIRYNKNNNHDCNMTDSIDLPDGCLKLKQLCEFMKQLVENLIQTQLIIKQLTTNRMDKQKQKIEPK